jgi:hypothetical protein
MKVGWSPNGGGHTVLISHGDIVTVYYHGAHKTALRKGQAVKAGDFIYQSGSTGASTGAHLHFEVRRGPQGRWGDSMDPEKFLPRAGTPSPVVPDVLPEPELVERPQPPRPPVFNRPISADHMSRLVDKFRNFPRRGM